VETERTAALERHLKLEGTYNVRDVGGYETTDGRITRWRRLLRADGMHRLTEEAQRTLLATGLRTIIDLRRPREAEQQPNVFATATTLRYRHLPLYQVVVGDHDERTLGEIYRWVLDECQSQIAAVIRLLAEPDALPGLVHCTAGKDRTGVIVALLLGAVNVPAETIVADYAVSAENLRGEFTEATRQRVVAAGLDWERYQRLLMSPAEFMQDMLAHLDTRYGGIQPYLRAIGIDGEELAILRDMLTE
jgi:protein-tyrosine phosphatase